MFPDGNRTRFFPFPRDALALLSYRCDNRSASARPKTTTDKRRVGSPAVCAAGAGFEPARGFPLTDNPNSAARRKVLAPGHVGAQSIRWTSGMIDRRHSVPGIEAFARRQQPLMLPHKTVCPPILADNRSTSAHLKWSGSRDLHPNRPLHRRRCCCYTTILAEWRPRQDLHLRPPPSHGGALI